MSGIAGVFAPQLADPRGLAARMAAGLQYRDSLIDLWSGPGVAMCRVHHESSNRKPQPSVNADGDRQLVFWGDLFNGEALRRDLRRPVAPADDAAVLLALLEERGDAAMRDLDGSFAFALHDAQKDELVVANDRFSSRPIYYTRLPSGGIAFGSQVRAVLQVPGVSRALDERAVRELFHYQRVHGTRTLNRSVAMVPPGTLLRISRQGVVLDTWFELNYQPESRSVKNWAEALADCFRRSTVRCLQGTRSAALLLSGGLDSRMIVAAADRPITCLHFNDSRNREFETAQRIAASKGYEFKYLQRPANHYAAFYRQGVDIGDGLYGYHHSHHIGLLPQDAADVTLHGFVPELFFRGTNLPHVDRTFLGRKFWTADFESLQTLDRTITASNVAREVQRRLKYSLHSKQLQQFFRERWAHDFNAQMLESAEDLVREAKPHSDEPLDWFIWADTRYHCKYPSALFELALRPFHTERSVVLHNDNIDLHLRMPVDMRSDSRVWNEAVRLLDARVADVPNANTGRSLFPSATDLAIEASIRLGRRLGLVAPPQETKREMPWHTDGSWPSFGAMLAHEPDLRGLLMKTVDDPECIDPDILDVATLRGAVDEHLSGRRDHQHFLMLVLTFGGWHRMYGPPGHGIGALGATGRDLSQRRDQDRRSPGTTSDRADRRA